MSNLEARFWAKVRKTETCWLWTAAKTRTGYGRFNVGGQVMYAHRVSWGIANVVTPDGLCVLHKCDAPTCVNPNHLFLGTAADNMRDRDTKGRHARAAARGEAHGHAKLTTEQVLEIRARPEQTNAELANDFCVSRTAISQIRTGKTWRGAARANMA